MKFRWLGILIATCSIFLTTTANATECTWGIFACNAHDGTGSTKTFNTLDYSQMKYFWNTNQCLSDSDVANFQNAANDTNDCLIWRGQTKNGVTNNLPDSACTDPIPGYGCPCLESTCVISAVDGDNRIKESHFTSARKCNTTNCDSRDPLGVFPGFDGYETLPTYNQNINGSLSIGDRIRVMVYSHNNATEQFPGDANYNNYTARNVKSKITWTNNSITGRITSDDTSDKTSPQVTIPTLPTGTHLEAIGAWHHYNTATASGTPNFTAVHKTPTDTELNTTNNSAEYNIGNHASCYGNIHRVYFDLEVKADATPDFTIEKTATQSTETELHPGEEITYTITVTNTGNTTLNNISVSDNLDTNLTYITGSEDITHNNGRITFTIPSLLPGDSTSKTINTQIKQNNNNFQPYQICNTAVANQGRITKRSEEICHNARTEERPNFTVEKTANHPTETELHPGEEITYTITVTNTGNTLLNNISVSDTLDSHLRYISGSQDITNNNNEISFIIPSLLPGEQSAKAFITQIETADESITYIPTVTQDGDHETVSVIPVDNFQPYQICNTATATGNDITTTSEEICHNVDRENTPLTFELQKTAYDLNGNIIPADTSIAPGTKFDYKISLIRTDDGITAPIESINIRDSLPTEITFISNLNDPAISNSSQDINLNFTIPEAGNISEKTFRVQLNPIVTTTNFCNTAQSTNLQYSVRSNTLCHNIKQTGPQISLSKRALDLNGKEIPQNTELPVGEIFNFEITLSKENQTLVALIQNLVTNVTDQPAQAPQQPLLSIYAFDPLENGKLEFVSNNGDTDITHQNGIVTLKFDTPSLEEKQTKTFQVRVLPNPDGLADKFCNEARTVLNNKKITSNEVCYKIKGMSRTVELHKTASIPTNKNLKPGQTFEYQISVKNDTPTVQTISVIDPLDSNIVFETKNPKNTAVYDPSTHSASMKFELVAPGQTQQKTLYVSTAKSLTQNTDICNQAFTPKTPSIEKETSSQTPTSNSIKDALNNIIEIFKKSLKWLTGSLIQPLTIEHLQANSLNYGLISEKVCHTIIPDTQNITTLEKSISNTGNITNGEILTYTIKFTSGENAPITTTLNDELDTNFTYIGNESITTSDDNIISGEITHDQAAQGGLVTLAVNDLPTDGWISFSFDVVVTNDTLPTEICNQAYEANNQYFSNIVCSPTTTGNGGSGHSISTIGICSDLANGSLTCRKHTPHPSMGEAAYDAWEECKKEDSTNEGLEACTREWANAVGLLALGECHPDDITSSQTTGGWREDFDTNGYVWSGSKPGDHDNECTVQIIPDECNSVSVCEEIDATITKSTNTPSVAKEENAQYNVEVNLTNTADPETVVLITGIKVYDLTIPTESGWLWNHSMTSQDTEWTWQGQSEDPATNYFEWNGDNFALDGEKSISLEYEMNTSLSIKSDTAQVNNVAFAVVEYQVIPLTGDPRNGTFYLGGGQDPNTICDTRFIDSILGSSSSLGATSSVQIIRPYIEVRGGGNIGVQKMTETTEQPFGGLSTNSPFASEISSGEILAQGETEELKDSQTLLEDNELRTDATDTEEILGATWNTTFDDSGVYFYAGDITLNGDFQGSKTFVIDGTLIIEEDFQPQGFGAFIANEIVIKSNVSNLTGIFISNGGEIRSNDKSDLQLVISGALMGDATDLLDKRNFIGVDPLAELEPSIKINYDLRLLDATPPALELFLSEDWTQTTE